jgi:hypothetical protein
MTKTFRSGTLQTKNRGGGGHITPCFAFQSLVHIVLVLVVIIIRYEVQIRDIRATLVHCISLCPGPVLWSLDICYGSGCGSGSLDPYLFLKDPYADPGGKKNTDHPDPDADPEHW